MDKIAHWCERIRKADDDELYTLVQAMVGGWRPIETAPKDGPVLIYGTKWKFDWAGEEDEAFAAVCSRGGGSWSVDNTVYYSTTCINPTHWMPLPEPPEEAT